MRSGRKRSGRHKQAIYENRSNFADTLNEDTPCVLAESEAAGTNKPFTKIGAVLGKP